MTGKRLPSPGVMEFVWSVKKNGRLSLMKSDLFRLGYMQLMIKLMKEDFTQAYVQCLFNILMTSGSNWSPIVLSGRERAAVVRGRDWSFLSHTFLLKDSSPNNENPLIIYSTPLRLSCHSSVHKPHVQIRLNVGLTNTWHHRSSLEAFYWIRFLCFLPLRLQKCFMDSHTSPNSPSA